MERLNVITPLGWMGDFVLADVLYEILHDRTSMSTVEIALVMEFTGFMHGCLLKDESNRFYIVKSTFRKLRDEENNHPFGSTFDIWSYWSHS